MNIFEDLIEELKEENLLEETVIEVSNGSKKTNPNGNSANQLRNSGEIDLPEKIEYIERQNSLNAPQPESQIIELTENPFENEEDTLLVETSADLTDESEIVYEQAENQPPISEKEFYRKRAMEEVSGLQMVEHVLSGVEREQMKAVPKPYDDLPVKKSLHAFLQISQDVKSPEHAQAEFSLMQETESWCSALSHRDKRISVAHLRRYCETTRPPLSSQALISLARFYRNSPFSESVRNKFDLVVTRLFTKDIGGDKRIIVFTRDELMAHLKELYAEWASIQLYSDKDDDSEIVLAAMKFEEFMAEAESADSFDDLVKTDFFNRLRLFKETTNELFYAPIVASTAIECNIRIGNKYVDLIENEREKANSDQLQDKYGFLHDQTISDATSKTLQLVELLKERIEEVELEAEPDEADKKPYINVIEQEPAKVQKTTQQKTKSKLYGVNKYLLAATIIIALLSGGLFVWVNYLGAEKTLSNNVKTVNLDNSSLKTFIQTARISENAFYGVTTPAWEGLSNEKKEETLAQLLTLGSEKGFLKVHLIDKQGKAVGTASKEKIEVLN